MDEKTVEYTSCKLDESQPESPPAHRETWKNKREEYLSAMGAVIGLGNIWRFPYITYKYGGGAFLIPYLTFAVVLGFPMFFLETSIGQFTRKGALESWKIVPLMKGIGLASAVVAFFSSVYFIVVQAWGILYFVHSFTSELPWTTCDHWYNTNSCITYQEAKARNLSGLESSDFSLPIIEYWNRYVTRQSDGLETLGTLENWPVVLCLLVSWIMVYFCLFRGTTSTGKVIYFSTIFPFITLAILLVRGVTLPGAMNGISFYLKPNLTQLMIPEVWVAAGGQVCYSYAVGFAVLVAYGSYSAFDSNCYRRSMIISATCSATSFIGGFAVFAILGHMAEVMDVDVKTVVRPGPGLAFIAYPTALTLMPAPQFWNACFFLMITTLAIDSQFSCLEGALCLFYDAFEWPVKNRSIFVAIVCASMFLFGLVFVLPGGIYVFEIFNNYAVSGISLLWIVFWQSVTVGWILGPKRYNKMIREMIGYNPSPIVSACHRYLTPALATGVLLFFIFDSAPLTIGKYVYPQWANGIGWLMTMCSFLCIPGYALYDLIWKRTGSFYVRLQDAIQSEVNFARDEDEVKEKDTDFNDEDILPIPPTITSEMF